MQISLFFHNNMGTKKEKSLSMAQIKNLSPSILLRMINKSKKNLKNDDTWKDVCKEYGETVDIMDFIPVRFGNLDVSAKTNKGIITLNYKLLIDDIDKNICQYLLHEAVHYLQQTCGKEATKSSDDGNYLKNPYEQEAFQNQISFIGDNFGKEEAEEYVDNLLDHHDVKKKKEKDELEAIFLEKV